MKRKDFFTLSLIEKLDIYSLRGWSVRSQIPLDNVKC